MSTTLYRVRALDTPADPFAGGELRADDDVTLAVSEGRIVGRGPLAGARQEHPGAEVVDLRAGLLLPGFVDAHVHYPQVRIVGALGMPLLRWLQEVALPEEARLSDRTHAAAVAGEFLTGLRRSGTTTALVFGSHFAGAVDELMGQAAAAGQRVVAGQVVSDRLLRPELHTDPARALAEGSALIDRWHGRGLLGYAVTPRFSLSASDALLEVCAELLGRAEGVLFTSHVNESTEEISEVLRLFPQDRDYLSTYARHGLVGPHSVLAHDVHPTAGELDLLGRSGATVAHCPTSNAVLGSGLFPMRRHLERGVHLALGSDVGAGTGFGLLKEGLQAYLGQRLLGEEGWPLTPAQLLHLATAAGARALGLGGRVGELSVGHDFDAVLVGPGEGSLLALALRHARDADDAVGRLFVLGGPADVARVWVAGRELDLGPAG